MSLRVAIACGGTGGHLFPGLAVAEELFSRGHEVLLVVSEKGIDAKSLAGTNEIRSRSLPMRGWPGFFHSRTIPFFLRLAKSWSQCGNLFQEFDPGVVLGMGGFTSAVPLFQGSRRGLPTLIHESNAVPGRVTRLVETRVDRVLLGFAACARHLGRAECVVTGTPVRRGLRHLPRTEAAAHFGLNPEAKTVLIMGGSQGATGLNRAVLQTLPRWQARRDEWQFIHLAGEDEANLCEINYRRNKLSAVVKPFSREMEACYSLADLVISRSGAGSLTELAHYGLPSLLVPYPAAADDHQTVNGKLFAEAGASLLFAQRDLHAEKLDDAVTSILGDETRRAKMAAAAQHLDRAEAARRVAEEVESCVRN